MGDYVVDPYRPYAKFHKNTITPFRPSPNMQKCALSDSASSFFWFLLLPTAKTPAPIFTTDTSNDARMCFSGVPKTKFYISTPLSSQNANFGKFLTRLRKCRVKIGLNNGDAYPSNTLNRHCSLMKVV